MRSFSSAVEYVCVITKLFFILMMRARTLKCKLYSLNEILFSKHLCIVKLSLVKPVELHSQHI